MIKQQLIGFTAEIKHKDNGDITKNFKIGIFRDRFDTDDVYMITHKEEIGLLMDPNYSETFTVIKAEPIFESVDETKREPLLIITTGHSGYGKTAAQHNVVVEAAKEFYGKHAGYTEAMERAFIDGARSDAAKQYHTHSPEIVDLFKLKQSFLKWHVEVFRSTHDVFEWFTKHLKPCVEQDITVRVDLTKPETLRNFLNKDTKESGDSDYRIELNE